MRPECLVVIVILLAVRIGATMIKPKLKVKLNLKPQVRMHIMAIIIMAKLNLTPNLKLNLEATFRIE